jgi:hypothetical protein
VDVTAMVTTGLQPSTTYVYRLVATSAAGTVAASEERSFTTAAPPPPPEPPATVKPKPKAKPRISCRLTGKRPKVACKVTAASGRRATVTLRRGGRVVARGSARPFRAGRWVTLRTVRRLARGRRYAVTVRLVDSKGRSRTLSASVKL